MDLIVEYINHLEINKALSFNTLRLYKRDLLDFHAFLEEKFPEKNFNISDLNPEILEKFRDWLLKKSNSTAGINRKLTALHGFWNWLLDEGHVSRDPFTQIIRESQFRNEKKDNLSLEDIESLLNPELHDLRTLIILEMIYGTGIRVGELVQVTLDDIDLEAQLLTIPRSAKFKERIVPFNDLLKSYIIKHQSKENLKAHDALLKNRLGERISEREVFRRVRDAKKRAGIKSKVSPSIIRNSFIKHLKDRGAFESFLKDLTGQKTC